MNKLRVFQNVNKRRKPYIYGGLLLFFLFFPYFITVLLGNSRGAEEETEILMIMEQLKEGHYTVLNETSMGKESIPLEIYVADKLMRTMGEDYEAEALKAQAVLLRTELISDQGLSVTVYDDAYGKKKIGKNYLLAAAQTRGIYGEYDGKPIYGAYCKVSNGRTRSAAEVLQTDAYPYLVSVACDKDFLSEEFADTVTFEKEVFEKIFEQIEAVEVEEAVIEQAKKDNRFEAKDTMDMIKDSTGYVLLFKYQEKWAAGEAMRYALNLPSASFQIEEDDNEILFYCKGIGHGLGFSQFAANEMALEGKDYIEILKYFFEGISLTKIE